MAEEVIALFAEGVTEVEFYKLLISALFKINDGNWLANMRLYPCDFSRKASQFARYRVMIVKHIAQLSLCIDQETHPHRMY